jgi:hypothetical protein
MPYRGTDCLGRLHDSHIFYFLFAVKGPAADATDAPQP